ncbi:MAG TPA: DUF4157 domain-containing protein [Phnomibacter sp.]|nr:DUF4157 domain-containing protein [Phnomibacter sp.]
MQLPSHVRLVENSWLARLAAYKMKAQAVALVVGKTIYLHGVKQQEFLANPRWVRHELAHIAQYQRMGTLLFLSRYLWYSLRYGYYQNPLEQEARQAESEAFEQA